MTTIQEISRDNISAIAHLATLLWSDTTQEEMLSHFEFRRSLSFRTPYSFFTKTRPKRYRFY